MSLIPNQQGLLRIEQKYFKEFEMILLSGPIYLSSIFLESSF